MKTTLLKSIRLQSIVLSAAALLWSTAAAAEAPVPAFKVTVSGHGKPMILIPGLASSGAVWDGTVARFCARDYQCHVLTLAGFAGQPAAATELLPNAETQLAAYIERQQLASPVIVGHSLGGFLALKLASDYPDKVGRLVIVDTLPALGAAQIPSLTGEQLQGVAGQLRERMRAQNEQQRDAGRRAAAAAMVGDADDAERIVGWGRQSDQATVEDAMYRIMATDLRQDIARIKAPTLVLGTWIAYKDYAPRGAIEATFETQYQKLPGVQIVLADSARHFIMYDDAQWMYQRIAQFLP